jgi:hypothetical protein
MIQDLESGYDMQMCADGDDKAATKGTKPGFGTKLKTFFTEKLPSAINKGVEIAENPAIKGIADATADIFRGKGKEATQKAGKANQLGNYEVPQNYALPSKKKNNTPIIIGSIIGGVVLLTLLTVVLLKRKKK